jgi:hypothetical protein
VAIHGTHAFPRRSITAVMLLLAAATALLLPCVCGPGAAERAGEPRQAADHSCCDQRPGMKAAARSCCADHDLAPPTWTPAGLVVLDAPSMPVAMTVASATAVALPGVPPRRPVGASPPLRI